MASKALVHRYQLLVRAGIKSKRVAWLEPMKQLPPLDLEDVKAKSDAQSSTSGSQSSSTAPSDEEHRILEQAFLENASQPVLKLTHEPTGLAGFEEYKEKIEGVLGSPEFRATLKDMPDVNSQTAILKAAIEHTKPKAELKTHDFLQQLRAQLDDTPAGQQWEKQEQGASQFVQSTARDFGQTGSS